jgi:hypothetical protein
MRHAYAHRASVSMALDTDPAAVGAAVTTAPCGHWDHQPPCPLAPHHTDAVRDGDVVHLRILFACEPDREAEVRQRVDAALAGGREGVAGAEWSLLVSQPDQVLERERAHAARLVAS